MMRQDHDIELNHLKYFYYTVLEGGVGQAANRLHVQQPVVSKMLKLLEENLGQALFWKKGRQKSLTDYGQMVFRHCQVVFGELGKIRYISENPFEIKGVLNVGAAEPIQNHFLAPILSKMMGKFPNININSYTSTQSHLLEMVSEGLLDYALLYYAPNIPSDLEVAKSTPHQFKLVVKSSLKEDKTVLQSFIGSREVDDHSTHSFPTVDLLRKKYPDTRIVFSSNSITLHKQLVKAGKGVSILPEHLVKKELGNGTLTELFPKKKFQWDLMAIKRKSDALDLKAETFLALI